jgi:hypothetical protein
MKWYLWEEGDMETLFVRMESPLQCRSRALGPSRSAVSSPRAVHRLYAGVLLVLSTLLFKEVDWPQSVSDLRASTRLLPKGSSSSHDPA